MPRRFVLPAAVLASSVLALAGSPALAAAPTAADPPPCAPTAAVPGASTPAPGSPCFTDTKPYPFGADGAPVNEANPDCQDAPGVRANCYLKVDSLAFRAWNRGLAATSQVVGDLSSTTAFGVWLFNGTRWFPDPTFPGQSVCKGNTVLWAGKRDYWLVGARLPSWPALCRFDGVNFEWQPLDVPRATLDRVPLDVNGKRRPGAMTSGACNAWDDCWFFGGFGTVVHWDGQTLSDASPDLAGQPWLRGDATAAVGGRTADGAPFALTTRTTGGVLKGDQLPPASDGSPPPLLLGASGGAFAPLPFVPPTVAQPGDPYRTDLVAVDADASRRAWVAGDPVGYRPGFAADPNNPSAGERRVTTSEPAPLVPLGPDGTARSCPGTPSAQFRYSNTRDGTDAFLWSSVAVLGWRADALAGGQIRPGTAAGTGLNDDGAREPVLVQARCDGPPIVTRFRMADPTVQSPAKQPLVPADRLGMVTAVAATAANDAWAATSRGKLLPPNDPSGQFSDVVQAPHLYRLTDGAPLGPAGDDDEPRPLVFQADPPIYVEAPPDPEPEPLPALVTTQSAPPVLKRVQQKAAIYGVKAKLNTAKLRLDLTFKVRRAVTIGAQALRRSTVVSRTGLKHFRPGTGRLTLKLSRRHWPTRIRFVFPSTKGATR